jgi:hypothetical protein
MKLVRSLFLSLALCVSFAAQAACGFADYGENTVLNHVFRNTSYSSSTPANYYVALYTTACADAATGTEVSTSGTGYARAAIARSTGAWNATNGTNGIISNVSAITFSQATADWGTVQSWCLLEAASGATNAVLCANLTASRNITTGSTPSFGAGVLTVTLD